MAYYSEAAARHLSQLPFAEKSACAKPLLCNESAQAKGVQDLPLYLERRASVLQHLQTLVSVAAPLNDKSVALLPDAATINREHVELCFAFLPGAGCGSLLPLQVPSVCFHELTSLVHLSPRNMSFYCSFATPCLQIKSNVSCCFLLPRVVQLASSSQCLLHCSLSVAFLNMAVGFSVGLLNVLNNFPAFSETKP